MEAGHIRAVPSIQHLRENHRRASKFSMMDPGEAFITGLITGQHDEIGTSQNDDDGDNDPVDKDASLFWSTSLDDLEARDIYRNGGA